MKRLSAPLDVQIELTEKCNEKCFHCYNYWRYSEDIGRDELGTEDFLIIIKKIKAVGVNSIVITGGEPFVRPELMFSVLEYCKNNDIKASINTNATLINIDTAMRIKRLEVTHVLVSLLGLEKTHNHIANSNTFKDACRGIVNLVNNGIKVSINMAVSKLNLSELQSVGMLVKNLGANVFCATPIVPSHESNKHLILNGNECKQMLRTLLEIRDDFNIKVDTLEPIARCLFDKKDEEDFIDFFGNRICSAAVTTCAISSKGTVRPCIHADIEFGSLLNEDFSVIWERMKSWSSSDILPKDCNECKAVVICEGGCRMSAKVISGCYNGKDMYMKGKITDINRVRKLPIKARDKELIVFQETDVFSFNPKCFLRKESFGGTFSINGFNNFVTDDGFKLLNCLKSASSFSSKIIKETFNLGEDETNLILNRLHKNKVITKGGDIND